MLAEIARLEGIMLLLVLCGALLQKKQVIMPEGQSCLTDRLLHPNILVWESRTLGAHSPHTASRRLGGACTLPAHPSPHTTHHRPRSGVVMRSALYQAE